MKKGFTLIELLAVILILGVIAVIVVPTVSAIIKKAKIKSFVASAQGIVKTAELKAGENDMDGLDNSLITLDTLEYKGKRYEIGSISFDAEGEIAIAIWNDALEICAIKDYNDSVVTVDSTITVEEDCTIGAGSGVLLTTLFAPNVGSNGSYGLKDGKNYFSGQNPNNWIEFGQASDSDPTPILWRVVNYNSEGIKLVYEGLKDGAYAPYENGTLGYDYWGSNNYAEWDDPTNVNEVLGYLYTNLLDFNNVAALQPINWCIGYFSYQSGGTADAEQAITDQCAMRSSNSTPYGLLLASDFYNGSDNSETCNLGYYNSDCGDSNYLYKNYYYWTSTLVEAEGPWQYGYRAWSVSPDLQVRDLDENMGVRPVINLKTTVIYNSGNGSIATPYTIK